MTTRLALLEHRRKRLEAMSPSEYTAWSTNKCNKIIEHHLNASNRSYRQLCDESTIIHHESKWRDHPIVDKAFIKRSDYAQSPAHSGRVVLTSTSGTTSTAITIPHTTRSIRSGLGDNFLRALLLGGASDLDRHWGIEHRVGGGVATGSQLSMQWLRKCFGRQALVTSTLTSMTDQIDVASRFDPWSISTSPGFLTRLASEDWSASPIRPQVVLFGGASLDAIARERIVSSFAPQRIVGFFPTTDAGALGASPEGDGIYETFSETHMLEVIDGDGEPVAEGEIGSLIVTSYDNLAAPLIRYRVGDSVRYLGRRNNRLLLSEITRRAEVSLGCTLLPLQDIIKWTHRIQSVDPEVVAVQLVCRTTANGLDQPIVRVVAPYLSAAVQLAAARLLDEFPQVTVSVAGGELLPPLVECVSPAQTIRGQFKLASYVDERN